MAAGQCTFPPPTTHRPSRSWPASWTRLLADTQPGTDQTEVLNRAPRQPPPPQVLTAILDTAKLPGRDVDPRDSFANVKASALVRMDENLTVVRSTVLDIAVNLLTA